MNLTFKTVVNYPFSVAWELLIPNRVFLHTYGWSDDGGVTKNIYFTIFLKVRFIQNASKLIKKNTFHI